jgi:hypothetical protein
MKLEAKAWKATVQHRMCCVAPSRLSARAQLEGLELELRLTVVALWPSYGSGLGHWYVRL